MPDLQISVRDDELVVTTTKGEPVLVQRTGAGQRPYLHPIHAPGDGDVVTDGEPGGRSWQRGLYTELNGVSGLGFWPEGLHADRKSAGRFDSHVGGMPWADADCAGWQVDTTYLDPAGCTILAETQEWQATRATHRLDLRLAWTLRGRVDVTFGAHDYGGPFLRVPPRPAAGGRYVVSEGPDEPGGRGRWAAVHIPRRGSKVGMLVAILDHPGNLEFPVPWRIDEKLGIGPAPSAAGPWRLGAGQERLFRYDVVVFEAAPTWRAVDDAWCAFAERVH